MPQVYQHCNYSPLRAPPLPILNPGNEKQTRGPWEGATHAGDKLHASLLTKQRLAQQHKRSPAESSACWLPSSSTSQTRPPHSFQCGTDKRPNTSSTDVKPLKLLDNAKKEEEDSGSWFSLPYIVIGAGLGAIAAPAVLTAAGFTGAGIAAGSLGSVMMKASAIFYGGGVPAGGVVATLQSLGATAGVSYAGAGAGSAAGYVFHKIKSGGEKDKSEE